MSLMTLTNGDVQAVARAVVKALAEMAPQTPPAQDAATAPVQDCYSPEDFGAAMRPARSAWWVRRELRLGRIKAAEGAGRKRIPHSELVRVQSCHAETRRRGGFNSNFFNHG